MLKEKLESKRKLLGKCEGKNQQLKRKGVYVTIIVSFNSVMHIASGFNVVV